MKSSLALLGSYASTLRCLINSKIRKGDEKKSIKQLLHLTKDEDWGFLCAAMDIIVDASDAIGHVQRFGLNGATKYDDPGEKYLRLYGWLNAIYIQQQAILKIYQIMNVPDLRKTKKLFSDLEIRVLRNKLAAHSTEYRNDNASGEEAYVPLRLDLRDLQVTYVNYTAQSHEEGSVHIMTATESHVRLAVDTMDTILEKAIETLYKRESKKKRDEYTEILSDLRIEKGGGSVVRSAGGPKLIVTITSSG